MIAKHRLYKIMMYLTKSILEVKEGYHEGSQSDSLLNNYICHLCSILMTNVPEI